MLFIIVGICIWIFVTISFFQRYRRTGLKSYLLTFLGSAIVIVGTLGALGFEHGKNEIVDELFLDIFIYPGGVLFIIGLILAHLDIMLGNVWSLEKRGEYKPALSRNLCMLLGFMATVGGIAQSLDAKSKMPYSGIYLIILGIAIFFVSLITLNGKKETNEEMETSSKLVSKKGNLAWGRNIAIALGFIGISGGIYKCFNAYPSISYSGIYLIALGLIAFVVMLMVLKGNRKRGKRGEIKYWGLGAR